MIRRFRQLSREVVDTNVIFQYCKDQVELPDGQVEEYVACVHKGASAVVPVLPDGRILMVHQYRYAIDRETIEIPAGGRNGTEEPFETAAKRELEEETGYTPATLTYMGALLSSPGFTDEVLHMYLARGLKPGECHPDEDEFLERDRVPLGELVKEVMDGTIQDAKTVAAVLKAKVLLDL